MEELCSYSPITLEKVGSVLITHPDDVSAIVAKSRIVQAEWAKTDPKERYMLIKKLRLTIVDNDERISKMIHDETGKTRSDCNSTEITNTLGMIKFCESWIKNFKFVKKVKQGPMTGLMFFLGRKSYIEYQPFGVIAVISPYNFPFCIPFNEIIMAIATGNSVILKTSLDTPLCGKLIEDLFEESGFPKGLVISINGPDVGQAITKSDVDKIIFTGSTQTGISIIKNSADSITPVILELGGKDAMLVLNDADIDRAVDGAIWGAFVNSGQVCVGVKRIYIQKEVYDIFLEKFVNGTKLLRQGDGWKDPNISIGPMINERALNTMMCITAHASEQGATIVIGGKRNPDLKGYFFEPTIITNLAHESDINANEIFGPIVALFPFETLDDGIRLANDSKFALGGSVWTRDLKKGREIASKLRSGNVDVNNTTYTFGLPATPWGGSGNSGFGTTHGEAGFYELMRPHHIHVDNGKKERDLWWMPYNELSDNVIVKFNKAYFGRDHFSISLIRDVFRSLKRKD